MQPDGREWGRDQGPRSLGWGAGGGKVFSSQASSPARSEGSDPPIQPGGPRSCLSWLALTLLAGPSCMPHLFQEALRPWPAGAAYLPWTLAVCPSAQWTLVCPSSKTQQPCGQDWGAAQAPLAGRGLLVPGPCPSPSASPRTPIAPPGEPPESGSVQRGVAVLAASDLGRKACHPCSLAA